MLGRAAYQTPGILAEADAAFYGEPARPFDPNVLLETMCAYAERHIAAGGRLGHVTRHMVGLFHGLPGARRYRQILSMDATEARRRTGSASQGFCRGGIRRAEPRSGLSR